MSAPIVVNAMSLEHFDGHSSSLVHITDFGFRFRLILDFCDQWSQIMWPMKQILILNKGFEWFHGSFVLAALKFLLRIHVWSFRASLHQQLYLKWYSPTQSFILLMFCLWWFSRHQVTKISGTTFVMSLDRCGSKLRLYWCTEADNLETVIVVT